MFENTKQESQYALQFGQITPGTIPKTPVLWPVNQRNQTQIQQTKGSAKPLSLSTIPTTQPNQSPVEARTTPKTVSNVRVVTRHAEGGRTVTVQFNHPPGDKYFSGANVYLKKAGQQPSLVASGAKSPLTFTASASEAPHSLFVTSFGNWGETNITKSPSHPVRLSNATVLN